MCRVFTIIVLLIFSSSVHANYFCSGKVRYLSVSNNGTFWLGIGSEYQIQSVCNVQDEYCKAWLSLAMAARMADKNLQLAYSNPNKSSGANCPINSAWGPSEDPIYDFNLKQ